MTATSILVCVIVLNLHHRDPNAPVPTWLNRIAYNILAPMLCMKSQKVTKKGKTLYQLCEFTQGFAIGTALNADIDQSENSSVHTDAPSGYSSQISSGYGHVFSDASTYNHQPADENGYNEQMLYLMKTGKKKVMLEEVVKHLRNITQKIREKDEQEVLKTQWKSVAKILDRFFLMVFVSIVIVSSTVLLYIYPMSHRNKLVYPNT